MERKKVPLHIRSLEDARDWLEGSFGEGAETSFLESNQVALREGIVLQGSIMPLFGIGAALNAISVVKVPEAMSQTSEGWRWAIVNDRKDILASGRGLRLRHFDWAEEAALLWRACLAWGPLLATRYVYATTCEESTTKQVSTPDGWELFTTDVVSVQGLPRIYYHWRKAVLP